MLRLLAVSFFALVALAQPAYATVESELVRQGVAAYDDLEYAKAISLLQKALEESLTREEKIVTYRTLAFSHAALEQSDAAKRDFVNLLHADPTFELDRRISPRVRAPFAEARAAIAAGHDEAEPRVRAPLLVPTVEPGRPSEGQAITVAAVYPGGVAESAELYFRARGQQAFSKVVARGEAGHFAATIPGLQVQPPGLEYYLVLVDDLGGPVATAGGLASPFAVDVRPKKRPIYTKAWFWGVIGAVVVAGVVGGVVGATVGGGNSKSATVTLLPQ
jgi:hypothetical protein